MWKCALQWLSWAGRAFVTASASSPTVVPRRSPKAISSMFWSIGRPDGWWTYQKIGGELWSRSASAQPRLRGRILFGEEVDIFRGGPHAVDDADALARATHGLSSLGIIF